MKPETVQCFPKVRSCALTGLLEHQSSLGALGMPSLLSAEAPLDLPAGNAEQAGVTPEGIAFPPVQGGSLGLPFTPPLQPPRTQKCPLL